MQVGIYARISEDRAGTALGIERQFEDGRTLAAQRGWTVVGEYHDNDLSALKGGRRPDYERLIADVRAGHVNAIVVWQTSRLWRNRKERAEAIELLRERGARVVPVKGTELDFSTAAGRMVAGILGEFDTAESEVKSERVARAALQRAIMGGNSGGPRPYGFGVKVGEDGAGKPILDYMKQVPAEAVEVAGMFRDLLAGVPLGAMARKLNARNVPTVTGRPWSRESIRDILMNARHAGLSEHKGEIVGKGKWPAIVTEDEWRAAVALLRDPKRRMSTGNRASYLLSGIAWCDVCGQQAISSGYLRQSAASTTRVYRCRANGCVTRQMVPVDQRVEEYVIARLSMPDAADLLVDRDRPDLEALRLEENAIRVQLDDAVSLWRERVLTAQQLRDETENLRARLEEIEAAQGHVDRAPILADLVRSDDVRATWKGLSLDRQRAVIQVVCRVVIKRGRPGLRQFDPSSVEVIPLDSL